LADLLIISSSKDEEGEIGMTLTDEYEPDLICQQTQHALLVAWGRFARHLQVSQRLRKVVKVARHQDAIPGSDLILQFGLASLAGYEYLRDLNLGSHPLAKDQAVADAWDLEFGHYTTISRFLYELPEAVVAQVQVELEAILQPYLHQAVHEILRHQGFLTLCGDLTGRSVSDYSWTYPPDTVFGYMANQLRKGHQVALVTLKGIPHRVHIAAFHYAGDTVSSPCLSQMVTETEARLGCRPRRRVELVRQRLEGLEAKIKTKQGWVESQQRRLHQHLERQIRLGERLRRLRQQIAELEAQHLGNALRPHSRLSQAYRHKASQEGQLQSALAQESQTRQVLARHQTHLAELQAQREGLMSWLAQLELDNQSLVHPVRIRWLLDGGFGDVTNVTYLIELGYDLYTIAYNGKTTQALLKQLEPEATWTQVGSRTQALEVNSVQAFGSCPYPLRLTLLRWQADEMIRHTTLLSFSEGEPLDLTALFPTYHQRQDVEAGIKQGKGTFGLTKLRVRSPAGLRLLEQFALVFWPNFIRWAAAWLINQVHDDSQRFIKLLQQIRPQVRVAAKTPAWVLTNPEGQLLQFDPDGPFAGVTIRLDRSFAYQCPLPLVQTGAQLWPISSVSVKERLATLTADQTLHAIISEPVASDSPWQPENLVRF
jgi:hypothetical protein